MIEALLGAGSSLLGGILGNKSQEKANAANAAMADKQAALQKEFAQSGIQWKVADAEKAGIHPLYALGANTISYSPQSVGGAAPSNFDFLGNAGQNIGRAIDSTRSTVQKGAAALVTKLQIEGMQLDNEFKKTQVASALQANAASNPGLPTATTTHAIPGQGNTPSIDGPTVNIKKTIAPGAGAVEVGATPEVALSRTKEGYAPMIPQQMAEALESDPAGVVQWWLKNKLSPNFKWRYHNPPSSRQDQYSEFWGDWRQPDGVSDLTRRTLMRSHRSWRPGKHRIPNAWYNPYKGAR